VKIEFGDGICPRTESDSQMTEVEDDANTWGRLVHWIIRGREEDATRALARCWASAFVKLRWVARLGRDS
jgi:hypothetical protein